MPAEPTDPPEVRLCEHCTAPLVRHRRKNKLEPPERFATRRYCNPACYRAHRAAHRHNAAKVCERPGCTASLEGMRARSRYCSRSCAVRTRNANPSRSGEGRPRSAAKRVPAPECHPATPEASERVIAPLRPEPYSVSAPKYGPDREMCSHHPWEPLTAYGCAICVAHERHRGRVARPGGDMPVWRG